MMSLASVTAVTAEIDDFAGNRRRTFRIVARSSLWPAAFPSSYQCA